MFGGQSHVDFDNDLAPYVEMTRKEIINKNERFRYTFNTEESWNKFIEEDVENQVSQAMQAVIFNLNTMHSRAGSQCPFSGLNIGIPRTEDAALVCKHILLAYEKGLNGSAAIFPNIAFRVKVGVNRNPEDKYYWLYQLSCRVTANRLNPTYLNLDAPINKQYWDQGVVSAIMGCRTYVCSNVNGEIGPGGRGNCAPASINLVALGIEAKGNIDVFMEDLKDMCDKAMESLLYRYSVCAKLRGRDLPFISSQGLIAGSDEVGPNDSIEPILKQGTWGIGFIGIAETIKALTGKNYPTDEGTVDLAMKIVSFMRKMTDEFTERYKLNVSLYATPSETLCSKFTDIDKERYGIIEGVTDKEYYTNSYHVPVETPIAITDKLTIEGKFHTLCNAGHISYIELDGYPSARAVEKIVTYACEHTDASYFGINFHVRTCCSCMSKVQDGANKCPKCGETHIQGVSRITGYLALDERFGKGKDAERRDRVAHNTEDHKQSYTINK